MRSQRNALFMECNFVKCLTFAAVTAVYTVQQLEKSIRIHRPGIAVNPVPLLSERLCFEAIFIVGTKVENGVPCRSEAVPSVRRKHHDCNEVVSGTIAHADFRLVCTFAVFQHCTNRNQTGFLMQVKDFSSHIAMPLFFLILFAIG